MGKGFTVPPKHRELILKRDNYKCLICGDNQSLTVHHIYGRQQCSILTLDVNNMITLCHKCHREYHKLYKDITPYTFSKYILGKTHKIKRVLVEWTDGRIRELALYDEPSMETRGFDNGDIKLTLIHVLKQRTEMSETELIEYMCSNYDTNRIEVHKALNELVKSKRIYRIYLENEGKTIVRISEMS